MENTNEKESLVVEDNREEFGVVYSAVTLKYAKEALGSAQRVKKCHPKMAITIYTDRPAVLRPYLEKRDAETGERIVGSGVFDKVIPIPMKEMVDKKFKLVPFAKISKIRAMASFPYKVTLYLDTDAKMLKPVGELWQWGRNWDIVIANSPKLDKRQVPYKLAKWMWKDHYNSGVICYRDSLAVRGLFRRWEALAKADPNAYRNRKKRGDGKFFDQPKLVKLVNAVKGKAEGAGGIKLKVVPNKLYNARHTMVKRLKKEKIFKNVKILHKH